MLRIIFVLLIIIPSIAGKGQRIINEKMEWNPEQELQIDLNILDSVKIESWNRNEILLEISVNIDDNKNNDKYELEISETKHKIEVRSSILKKKNINADIHAVLRLPAKCPLTFETINGNVEITGHEAALRIRSISGFIDLSINPERSLKFYLKSISGEVFTDLTLNQEKTNTPIVGIDMEATLNGGKEKIDLETISGNIYIRARN